MTEPKETAKKNNRRFRFFPQLSRPWTMVDTLYLGMGIPLFLWGLIETILRWILDPSLRWTVDPSLLTALLVSTAILTIWFWKIGPHRGTKS